MLEAAHQRVEFLGAAGVSGETPQPFAKGGVEGGVLGSGDEASLLDEGFIGAEGDFLHTRTVYLSKVAKQLGWTEAGEGHYTGRMEVRLSPELQAKLDRMAAEQGRDAESLVHEAVDRLVGYDDWFLREVEKGLAQVERGEVLTHEEVGSRVEKLLSEKQRRV
jgi:predicted transcriptional regulator